MIFNGIRIKLSDRQKEMIGKAEGYSDGCQNVCTLSRFQCDMVCYAKECKFWTLLYEDNGLDASFR